MPIDDEQVANLFDALVEFNNSLVDATKSLDDMDEAALNMERFRIADYGFDEGEDVQWQISRREAETFIKNFQQALEKLKQAFNAACAELRARLPNNLGLEYWALLQLKFAVDEDFDRAADEYKRFWRLLGFTDSRVLDRYKSQLQAAAEFLREIYLEGRLFGQFHATSTALMSLVPKAESREQENAEPLTVSFEKQASKPIIDLDKFTLVFEGRKVFFGHTQALKLTALLVSKFDSFFRNDDCLAAIDSDEENRLGQVVQEIREKFGEAGIPLEIERRRGNMRLHRAEPQKLELPSSKKRNTRKKA